MTTLLVSHPSLVEHLTGPGHPERPDRMRAIDKVLAHEVFAPLVRKDAPMREDAETYIRAVHPGDYYEKIKARAPQPGDDSVHLDGDTVMSAGSLEAALRAVGSGLLAVDVVMDADNDIKNAFCQVRPPGHHAEANRAMGFCIFSNIAIAAHYARMKYGLERVAVVDFDVHHGNGTQAIFWSDKDLFYGSTHQMPLFPGTGAKSETGVGNICNAPLSAGDGGAIFKEAFEARVLPELSAFSPDMILISAGFDAHDADPLGGLRLVESDFMWASEQLAGVAERQCSGRVVSMLEGGYNLNALARSVGVHVRTLMDVAS